MKENKRKESINPRKFSNQQSCWTQRPVREMPRHTLWENQRGEARGSASKVRWACCPCPRRLLEIRPGGARPSPGSACLGLRDEGGRGRALAGRRSRWRGSPPGWTAAPALGGRWRSWRPDAVLRLPIWFWGAEEEEEEEREPNRNKKTILGRIDMISCGVLPY